MSYSDFVSKVIPDGSKLDELSKEYLQRKDDSNLENLYIFSILGMIIPIFSPIVAYAVNRRKEVMLGILVVLSGMALSLVSFIPGLGAIISLSAIASFVIWVRGIYLFFTEFLPYKEQREKQEEDELEQVIQNAIYTPKSDNVNKDSE